MQKGTYAGYMAGLNNVGIERFVLRPGMEFGAARKWWVEGQRSERHNGIDLRYYIDRDGAERELPSGAKVAAVRGGRVVAVIEDLIGSSVFVMQDDGLVAAYGHIEPCCAAGDAIKEGQDIGVLASKAGVTAPPHLHISLFKFPDGAEFEGLTWQGISKARGVETTDPSGLL